MWSWQVSGSLHTVITLMEALRLDGETPLVKVLLSCSGGVDGVLAGIAPHIGCSAVFVADADQGYRDCGG